MLNREKNKDEKRLVAETTSTFGQNKGRDEHEYAMIGDLVDQKSQTKKRRRQRGRSVGCTKNKSRERRRRNEDVMERHMRVIEGKRIKKSNA